MQAVSPGVSKKPADQEIRVNALKERKVRRLSRAHRQPNISTAKDQAHKALQQSFSRLQSQVIAAAIFLVIVPEGSSQKPE